MAIAELGVRIGVLRKVAERATPKAAEIPLALKPIEPFTRQDTLSLARAYLNSRWHLLKPYSDLEKARLLGVVKVEKLALEALGQHHIVGMGNNTVQKTEKLDEEDLTAVIRSFSEKDIRRLEKMYRDSRSFAVGHELEDKEWTEMTLEEMETYARMTTSGQILDTLGQRDLVISINESFTPPSERVNWAANRSTGQGNLM